MSSRLEKGGGYSVYVDEPEAQAAIRKQVETLRREGVNASLQTSRVVMGGRGPHKQLDDLDIWRAVE